jgi:endonuclease/exonuclease/phosphatase family metal-dependent hydrolase
MRILRPALLIAVFSSAALAQSHAADEHAERTLHVMSFNIRYGKAPDGENAWPKRRELVSDVIRQHHPDMVGLQEALRFQLDDIRKALPEYDEIGVARENGQDKGEYNTILYRTDRLVPLERGNFWYSDTPTVPGSKHWGNRLPRLCTWVGFAMKGSADEKSPAFYYYNTHLDHESQPSRARSAELLAQTIEKRKHPAPVIVSGDFNVDEKNPVVLYLTGNAARPTTGPADAPAPKSHLVDTFRKLHPDEKVFGTFNGFKGKRTGDKIDYILVSPDLKVLESDIVRDNKDGRYPSDHFPIEAVVQLKSNHENTK